jgi:hypothetical protein
MRLPACVSSSPNHASVTVARCTAVTAVLALSLLVAAPSFAQSNEIALHGADSVFVAPDIAVVWAVLKQPQVQNQPEKAAVWLRLVNSGRKFSHYSIDGVDPFSKKRERVDKGALIAQEVRVASDRDSFADLTSREIHFYVTEADWKADKPALTVYYLGVPDTTPEFSSRPAMDAYLNTVKLVGHK